MVRERRLCVNSFFEDVVISVHLVYRVYKFVEIQKLGVLSVFDLKYSIRNLFYR